MKQNKTKISMIAAIGQHRELGKDNKLLWSIPEDMKRFKELTTGHTVIMGRKTYESIGRALPNRVNVVITRDKSFKP
ncbi:MAG: dihydrofolate reductase, partial [bacterium]|nr:dihydrofolate reductase [bacterium]